MERCGLCGRLTRHQFVLNGRNLCERCERRLVTLTPADAGYDRLRKQMKRLIFE